MGRPVLVPSRDIHEVACSLPRCRLRTPGRDGEGPRLGFRQEQALPAESRCSSLPRSTGVGRRCAWRRASLARREQCAFLRRPRRDQTPVVPSNSSASPTTFITLSSRWNRSQEVVRSSHRIVRPPRTPATTFIAAETVKNSVVKSSACLSIPPTEYEPSSSPRTTFSSTSAITVQLVDRRRGCVFCLLLFRSFQHGVVELPMKEWRASGARVQQQPCRLRACLSEA